jgi:hypothetical protein
VSKYSISRISNNKVEDFWINSPQSSVFTHPNVLEEFAKEVHWWAVFKGQEIQCVWPITLNDKRESFLPPFSYWQGPFWTKKGFNHPYHRTLSVTTSVYELFIKHLFLEYGSIKASLHPSLLDVRVFDWWNYHEPNKPKFIIKPRYTALITNIQKSNKDIEKNFRVNKRRDLKKFEKIKKSIYFDNLCSEEEFITFYKEKLKIEKAVTSDELISLLRIVRNGHGWIQAARQKKNSTLCGLIIVFQHQNQANLIINLALNEFKREGLMPASVFKAIETARDRGLKYFDFNGANSPARGDDKHSFDAEPVLYFDLEYNGH